MAQSQCTQCDVNSGKFLSGIAFAFPTGPKIGDFVQPVMLTRFTGAVNIRKIFTTEMCRIYLQLVHILATTNQFTKAIVTQ